MIVFQRVADVIGLVPSTRYDKGKADGDIHHLKRKTVILKYEMSLSLSFALRLGGGSVGVIIK